MSAGIEDILDMHEAAELAGRTADSMRKACQRGNLEAKRVGGVAHRATWVTTRAAVIEYLAYSQSRAHFLPRDAHGRIVRPPGRRAL
jgi:hypothetical protein